MSDSKQKKAFPHFLDDFVGAEAIVDRNSAEITLPQQSSTSQKLAKKQISLRLDAGTIDALKQVAVRKGIGYQTLIRMWVVERLNDEL